MFNNYLKNVKAILFDLDGTIVKTEELWREAAQQVADLLPNTFINVDTYWIPGKSLHTFWKDMNQIFKLGISHEIDDYVHKTNEAFKQLTREQEIEVTEGFWLLAEYLKIEKNLKLGLVTGSTKEITEYILQKIAMTGVFDTVVTGDMVKNPKPSPEIYKHATKELKINAKEILVFEDSEAGCKSALGAGMKVILLWDADTDKNDYPIEVLDYVTAFTGLDEAFEKDPIEGLLEEIKKRVEAKRQK